jgi:hypothetical protein
MTKLYSVTWTAFGAIEIAATSPEEARKTAELMTISELRDASYAVEREIDLFVEEIKPTS